MTDHGVGFIHEGPPTRPPFNAESGRGLYLIAQLSDHFHLNSSPTGGTTVRFAKRLVFTDTAPTAEP